MPVRIPLWSEYLSCPICFWEYSDQERCWPINMGCGHTVCKDCWNRFYPKECPFDQLYINLEPENVVMSTAMLVLNGHPVPETPIRPSAILRLPDSEQEAYDQVIKAMEELARHLRSTINCPPKSSKLSKSMQRKIVNLMQCTLLDDDGKVKAYKSARYLGERTVNELILQQQNQQQLSTNLWAAVRARGCQFLGPAMQEEVLKLVLLTLEDGSQLARKNLVMYVVQRLEDKFPTSSKTSIGHVVQLLYRASCFKLSKRDCDSSLMQLKEEFRTYENLRREHDAQIVQIATEAGLRIAPDQWSALLYGDSLHRSHMQSIIDSKQNPTSFSHSIKELMIIYQRSADPSRADIVIPCFQTLLNIEPHAAEPVVPTYEQLAKALTAVQRVVEEVVNNRDQSAQQSANTAGNHGNNNNNNGNEPRGTSPGCSQWQEGPPMATVNKYPHRYKTSFCIATLHNRPCKWKQSCHYAHTEEELLTHQALQSKNTQSQANNNWVPNSKDAAGSSNLGSTKGKAGATGFTKNSPANVDIQAGNNGYKARQTNFGGFSSTFPPLSFQSLADTAFTMPKHLQNENHPLGQMHASGLGKSGSSQAHVPSQGKVPSQGHVPTQVHAPSQVHIPSQVHAPSQGQVPSQGHAPSQVHGHPLSNVSPPLQDTRQTHIPSQMPSNVPMQSHVPSQQQQQHGSVNFPMDMPSLANAQRFTNLPRTIPLSGSPNQFDTSLINGNDPAGLFMLPPMNIPPPPIPMPMVPNVQCVQPIPLPIIPPQFGNYNYVNHLPMDALSLSNNYHPGQINYSNGFETETVNVLSQQSFPQEKYLGRNENNNLTQEMFVRSYSILQEDSVPFENVTNSCRPISRNTLQPVLLFNSQKKSTSGSSSDLDLFHLDTKLKTRKKRVVEKDVKNTTADTSDGYPEDYEDEYDDRIAFDIKAFEQKWNKEFSSLDTDEDS